VELIFAVRDARKREAKEVDATVPDELNEILNKLMSRSRSQRFQSGAELALALRLFLDRYKAGYRRSHFGRYMRATFEADIERELRLMEEYVIEGADPSKVGENLIADALGNDAPYTKFTAAIGGSRADTGNFPRMERRQPTDLHAEETRILTRNQESPLTRPLHGGVGGGGGGGEPEKPPLAEMSTQILDRSQPGLHELPTGPKDLPDLHAQNTQILMKPPERPRPPTPKPAPELPELHGLETKIIVRDVDTRAPTTVGDLSGMIDDGPLVQLDDDLIGATTERAPERPRRDTMPTPQLQVDAAGEGALETTVDGVSDQGLTGPRQENAPGGFVEGEESTTSVPLTDEDLEEGTES
jgi:hypothetical protein